MTVFKQTNVQRGKVNEFLRSLGIDPSETMHVEITPFHLYVREYARDASGQIYVIREENGTSRVASNTRHLEIKDDDEARAD